ncbi:hypothetical protein [Actinomadura sp. KC216]|uniref:hypothetical protein n=1 Tax=Actinomadura sp. KC216 TaxID=2530370 RepID=UPI0014053B17|nr:hypothetical protein [Actinomadura sp. KC216]
MAKLAGTWPCSCGWERPLRLTLLGGLVSPAIETARGLLVTGRAFDIEDVA